MYRCVPSSARRAPSLVRRLCKHANPDAAISHALAADETPIALQRRVAALDALQAQFEEQEKLHERKLRELEQSFYDQTRSIMARRSAIVAGSAEPSDEEVASSSFETEHLVGAAGSPEPDGAPTGVPGFWAAAMKQCVALHDNPESPAFTDKDWEVLEHLEDIRMEPWMPPMPSWSDVMGEEQLEQNGLTPEMVEAMDAQQDDDENDLGFVLRFRFAKGNPFFETDEELAIYCHSHGEVAQVAPEVLQWRDGKDPTVSTKVKRKKRKGSGVSQRVTIEEPQPSFFRIFAVAGEDGGDEAFGEDVSEMQERLCTVLREHLVPHATAFYIQALLETGDDGGFGDEDAWDDEDLSSRNGIRR